MPPESAVAVREDQHPIIAKIDAKMPEIAGMLPEGMRPDRFRKVVVQALLRNPDLWSCTPISVVTAITEAAEVGIEPTGVLGKGWLLPYNSKQPDGSWAKEAKFIPGWRGFVDLCWRADRLLLTPELVREGDAFEYRRGTDAYLHHVPILDQPGRENDDANVTFAYVIVRFPDGRVDFEVMSRTAIERIAERAKKRNPVWESDWGEMAKKTPIRRIAKRLPLSPALQRILAGDEAADFDTPVERASDPKRSGLRDRISQRTAAIRGEPDPGESDASIPPAGGAVADEVSGETPAAGSLDSKRKGDPWMARIHAIGAERGMDHDALHDWVVEHFQVQSLADLTIPQRADFMELVERMPLIGEEVPA
jgi:recombination protein RecT